VAVRARFDDAVAGLAAVERAYDEVGRIHRLMSFQDPDSDLARLRRAEPGRPVAVDPRTRAVLAFALALADETQGVFDPTLGAEADAADALPGATHDGEAAPVGDWRDVILADDGVILRRPVWLDLGGVAKGFAVDRAVEILRTAGAHQVCVNAGGDLRVHGSASEAVRLAAGDKHEAAIIEIVDGALASSGGRSGEAMAAHFDGRTRGRVDPARFASVTAPTCMVVDALTKVVLADPEGAVQALARHGARAYSHDAARGWRAWEPVAA
jgi:thiamine biosynthesis lipoprotein